LGYFLLMRTWQYLAPNNFWSSSSLKMNLVLSLLYTAGGAAASFGGAYLYSTQHSDCRMINNMIPNMALADVVANSFVRMPFFFMIISHLVAESNKPGQLEEFNKQFTHMERTIGLVVTVMTGGQLICFLWLYASSLVPILIANGVVVSMQEAAVYSAGSSCLYLYRYLEFEAVFPIVGLGFLIVACFFSKCHKESGSGWYRASMVFALLYLIAGSIVMLYAISLVATNGSDCRMMSDAVVNMANVDIVVNGCFRLPCMLLAFWAFTVFAPFDANSKDNNNNNNKLQSIPLVSP